MQTSEASPIACALDFQDMAARLDRIRRLTRNSLLGHRFEGNTLYLTYRADASNEVRSIVELERVCCAFLEFGVTQSDGGLTLSIRAPEESGEASRLLFANFIPEDSTALTTPAPRCCGSCG
ncbi:MULTISPECIES: hypothetical protein [Variovorax]|jgi:hypothetical protein|uniref:hypothetical protein n=1 Tax=Variovorax TaxID=34072 RepID=UPI0010F5E780|nr:MULTISPECIES: hypothetical protein [Variovorax]MBN8756307.1 hypothetical protein [Variovorax sp.]UKI10379.1 hypothetical protein L3V85_11195 [Variovorax paradoxus]